MRKLVAALVLAIGLAGCDTRVMLPEEVVKQVKTLNEKQAEELATIRHKGERLRQLVFMMAFGGVLEESDIHALGAIDALDYYHAVATKALYEQDTNAYALAISTLQSLHTQLESKLKQVAQRYAATQEKSNRIVW